MQQQGKELKLSTYKSRAEYFKNRRNNLKKLVVELTIEERQKLEEIVTREKTTIRGWITKQIETNY